MKRKKKVRDIVSVSMDYVGRSKVKKEQEGKLDIPHFLAVS